MSVQKLLSRHQICYSRLKAFFRDIKFLAYVNTFNSRLKFYLSYNVNLRFADLNIHTKLNGNKNQWVIF